MDEDDNASGAADDSPFHRLATLRYQCMVRPFYPRREDEQMRPPLGSVPNHAPDLRHLRPAAQSAPMGSMS